MIGCNCLEIHISFLEIELLGSFFIIKKHLCVPRIRVLIFFLRTYGRDNVASLHVLARMSVIPRKIFLPHKSVFRNPFSANSRDQRLP